MALRMAMLSNLSVDLSVLQSKTFIQSDISPQLLARGREPRLGLIPGNLELRLGLIPGKLGLGRGRTGSLRWAARGQSRDRAGGEGKTLREAGGEGGTLQEAGNEGGTLQEANPATGQQNWRSATGGLSRRSVEPGKQEAAEAQSEAAAEQEQ